jgi:ketosteroid isomerase-like protein
MDPAISRMSEVLGRKRALTFAMIRNLHEGLGIPVEGLIGRSVEVEDQRGVVVMLAGSFGYSGRMIRQLLLPFCIALAAFAQAENLRKVAEFHEAGFRKAMLTEDVAWFKKMAAPDYTWIGTNGQKIKAADSEAQMKQSFANGTVKKVTTKVLKVVPTKRGMTVTADVRLVVEMAGDKGKKPTTMDMTMRYEESWSKTKGQWKIHSVKVLKEKNLVDGKPM